jgi:hypothetical protein
LEELHRRYGDQVEFLAVYVREAHAANGVWPSQFKDQAGEPINQPTQISKRAQIAGDCCKVLEITMPLLVDDVDDRVGRAYSGMPDRMYVIARGGQVVYKGGRGPFGFKPGEMEQSLVMLLLDAMGDQASAVAHEQ